MEKYSTAENLVTNFERNQITAFEIIEGMEGLEAKTLKIHHEDILPEKSEYRRCHRFSNIGTFLSYIAKYKTKDTVIYFNPEASCCFCILDDVKTIGGEELLTCSLLCNKLGKEIEDVESVSSAIGFLDFIKRRKKLVHNFAQLAMLFSAIKISNSVETLDIKGKNSEYNLIVKSTIQGQEKGTPASLPDLFEFEFVDYSMSFDTPMKYIITADLYYQVTKEHKLQISIFVNNKDEVINQMHKQYFDLISKSAPPDTLVVIGKPVLQSVKRVDEIDG